VSRSFRAERGIAAQTGFRADRPVNERGGNAQPGAMWSAPVIGKT